MRYRSLINSSLHNIRCCDENTQTQTDPGTGVTYGWRALPSSVSCVLDSNGNKTGYAHVDTLEQYDKGTGAATGVTKPNSGSDPNHVVDYVDNVNCAQSAPPPSSDVAHNFNGCSGHLSVELVLESDNSVFFNYDVNPNGGSLDKTIPEGSYQVTLSAPQNQPTPPAPALHVAMTVNSKFAVVPTEQIVVFHNIVTPINISVRPTTQATTGGGGL